MSELLKELNKLQLIKVGRLHNKDQKQENLNEIKLSVLEEYFCPYKVASIKLFTVSCQKPV